MNIKIGKGGSGKISSTKGGSGKTNQRKYIDLLPSSSVTNNLTFLFDPIFYKSQIQNERYQVLAQGCSLPYVNGIYSQTVNPSLVNNRPYFVKDDDSNMVIYYDGTNWLIEDLSERDYANPLFYKIGVCYTKPQSSCRPDNLDWSTVDGGNAYNDDQTPPTITQHLKLVVNGGNLDPAFLEQIRNYQINNTIPNQGLNRLTITIQDIARASFNTRKVAIKNNMLSYLKDPNNNDVEPKNFRKIYRGNTLSKYGIETPQDNRESFLILRKNDNSILYTSNNSTLNFFISLQRPVSHKNPHSGYIVREKRGTFLTSYANYNNHISFGYRSPYYNINGDKTYKLKFEPFSFVFSFGTTSSGFFRRPINYTVMTDYKFKFGQVYLISIQIDNRDNIRVFVNAEMQDLALLPFNPLINRTWKGPNATYYAERINQSPLAPGFLKKNGSVYPYINSTFSGCPNVGYTYLIFGKSKLQGVQSHNPYSRILKRKRFLNNLDIGVINSYSIALSQSQISEMYNNFRYRYL
jgi:hypothetical protein